MEQRIEPAVNPKEGLCSYCGDAPVNHVLSYAENLISINLDFFMADMVYYAPSFLKRFAEWIPVGFLKVFLLLGFAKLSEDMSKVASFRSRIIWEEAMRRGIVMKQIILFNKPSDYYQAVVKGRKIYFESLPVPPQFLDMRKNWDDKFILKNELSKENIPIPAYRRLSLVRSRKLEEVFGALQKPIIVKPQVGSRARHTVTHIQTLEQLKDGVGVAGMLSPYLIVEEHLEGHVCRATLVNGVLAGFYIGRVPHVTGDGVRTLRELIEEKDSQRKDRVEKIRQGDELNDHIARFGLKLDDVVPRGVMITLSHRRGRLFGGTTQEMIDELHPSFIPILERAAKVVGLFVAGFDCIIPDPTQDESSQRWGIIECNTLPFIDLHYYALEGKPRNIAGMIWDAWE